MLKKIQLFQDKESIKKTASLFFYLALITEVLIVVIDKSAYINPVEGRLFQITFCFFFLKVILTRYEKNEYACIFIFCALGLIVDRLSDRNEILRFIIFIAACKDIDIKRALKLVLWLTAAGCAVIILLSVSGIYGAVRVIKEYPGEYVGEITKNLYSFGMGNANSFHCMFFSLTLLFMYLYEDRLKWYVYAAIFVMNAGLYFLTDSKTGTALTALSVMAMGIIKRTGNNLEMLKSDTEPVMRSRNNKQVKAIGRVCLAINAACVIISVWFAAAAWRVHYLIWFNQSGDKDDHHPIIFANKILTGRIRTLTGTNNWDGTVQSWRWLPVKTHTQYFDLGYVRLFYWYGIIAASIIIAVFGVLLVYIYRNEMYMEIVFITIICLYTVVEAHFVSVYIGRNYLLFILGGAWTGMLSAKRQLKA